MYLSAIRAFGFESLAIAIEDLTASNRVIQLGLELNRIDLMTSISGVGFDEAWQSRAAGEIDGIPVNFNGRDELLRNKAAAGRPKDRIDIDALRKHGRSG